jgi:ABC-type Zn uptake system ZnuABC Zn-binding protein ZnuA
MKPSIKEKDPVLVDLFKGSHNSYKQNRAELLSDLEAAAARAAQRVEAKAAAKASKEAV